MLFQQVFHKHYRVILALSVHFAKIKFNHLISILAVFERKNILKKKNYDR